MNEQNARSADPEELGRRLCPALYAATKLVGMYGPESHVAQDALATLQKVFDAINAVFGFTSIRVSSETLFVNDHRVRMNSEGFMAFEYVVDLLSRRHVGEVRISAGASERDLSSFIAALQKVDPASEEPLEDLREFMKFADVHEIDVYEVKDLGSEHDHGRLGDLRESSIQHYTKAVFCYGLLQGAAHRKDRLDLRKLGRIVQGMVDILERNEATLLALTGMKGYGGFQPSHAVHVAILSMVLGLRLQMPRNLLSKLGLAAMIHDIGRDPRPGMPPDIDADHTTEAAHQVLNALGFTESGIRCAMAALSHHDPAQPEDGPAPSLAARIYAVADFFDTATTPPNDEGCGRPAKDVLEHMARDEKRFDRRLVTLLANVVGAYPIASLVELETGETGVVCWRGHGDHDPARPLVRVVRTADGQQPTELIDRDLAEKRADGTYLHEVTEAYAPRDAYGSFEQFTQML